ncbi:MAG: hypothetical protein ACP5TI_06130 [Thermoprotei archaeon]
MLLPFIEDKRSNALTNTFRKLVGTRAKGRIKYFFNFKGLGKRPVGAHVGGTPADFSPAVLPRVLARGFLETALGFLNAILEKNPRKKNPTVDITFNRLKIALKTDAR